MRSHSASVVSSIAALDATPAFETTMSTPPKRSTAAANAAATESSLVTSPPTARPPSPSAADRILGAVAVEVEGDHAGAGAARARRTTARPIPPAAPVTSATAPCSSPGGGASESL